MSLQNKNAGNSGDQLKHALLLELIERLREAEGALDSAAGTKTWSYAETHAGAGCYETPYAQSLLAAAPVESGQDEILSGDLPLVGLAYARALHRFDALGWSLHTPRPYPGSALLAQLSSVPWASIALAEADPAVLDRLASNLILHRWLNSQKQSPLVELWPGSFERSLGQLLLPKRLLLQVDPYYYETSATDGEGGRLGNGHLRQIVAELQTRDAILLMFASHRPREKGSPEVASLQPAETYPALCEDLASMNPPIARCFRATGTPHAVVVAGWGAGCGPVADLPSANAWAHSWLTEAPLSLGVSEEPVGAPRPEHV